MRVKPSKWNKKKQSRKCNFISKILLNYYYFLILIPLLTHILFVCLPTSDIKFIFKSSVNF